jgi:hypothetical protein
VRFETAVFAIFGAVLRLPVAAKISAVDSTMPLSDTPACSRAIASRSLCVSTNAVLYWQSRSRLSCNAATPFAPFTKITIAASKSVNDILREAKIVPLVTLNCV